MDRPTRNLDSSESGISTILEELRYLRNEVNIIKERGERRGRPLLQKGQLRGKKQEGLKQTYTRYTFFVKEELLRQMKELCKRDAKKMKQVMEEAITSYLEKKNAG